MSSISLLKEIETLTALELIEKGPLVKQFNMKNKIFNSTKNLEQPTI